MGSTPPQTEAVALIAAMITPALLILASASLVASALVRMARVVDRARFLATVAQEGTWGRLGLSPSGLRDRLQSHALRARHAGRSIALFYAAIVLFIVACLSIVAVRAAGPSLGWLPLLPAIGGTLVLLAGGAYMVAESSAGRRQIDQEIQLALSKLEKLP